MKRVILKYGIFGLITGLVFFGAGLLFGDDVSHSSGEIIGYSAMIVSLSFVFFGMKHYRDKVNNGLLSFKSAMIIGMCIAALVGLGVALADYVYTTVINPDFAAQYLEATLKNYEAMYSGAELEAKKQELEAQMDAYGGSGFMAALMFITVLLIGFLVSLISALFLQRNNQ
jgi:hypothetical protein